MSGNLISIASSGLSAASAAINVTAENISNSGTTGYVRRSVSQEEIASNTQYGTTTSTGLSGVTVTGTTRDTSTFLQGQVYSSTANSARADQAVTNLTNVSDAVENSGVNTAITSFQSSVEELSSDPTDTSLRETVLADAQNLSQSFNLASTSLATATQGIQADATSAVSSVNTIASSLAQVNQQIAADPNANTDGSSLLDTRDQLLTQLSSYSDFTASYGTNGTVSVTLGGSSGQTLVSGSTANTLSSTTASDGTISYALNDSTISVSGGSLAADQQGLVSAAAANTTLNSIASSLMSAVNTTQANGSDLDGDTGAAMFSGTGAGDMAVSMTSSDQIATAAAGSAADSSDNSNVTALQTAITSASTASGMSSLIFSTSNAVSSATTAQTTLDAITTNATTQLSAVSGVDLNTEAANLIQYQQAFQASGKVIQTAETIFNQLLAIQ